MRSSSESFLLNTERHKFQIPMCWHTRERGTCETTREPGTQKTACSNCRTYRKIGKSDPKIAKKKQTDTKPKSRPVESLDVFWRLWGEVRLPCQVVLRTYWQHFDMFVLKLRDITWPEHSKFSVCLCASCHRAFCCF